MSLQGAQKALQAARQALSGPVTKSDVCTVIGLAFLWLYPYPGSFLNSWLSDASSLYGEGMATVLENLYSIMLCVCFVVLLLVGGFARRPFMQRRLGVVAVGCMGLLGAGLLACAKASAGALPLAVAVCGLLLEAVFLSSMVVGWGVQGLQGRLSRAVGNVLLSYVLLIVLMMACSVVGSWPAELALVVSPALLCLGMRPASSPPLRRESFTALPWATVLAAIVLVYAATWLLHSLTGTLFTADPIDPWRNLQELLVVVLAAALVVPFIAAFPEQKALNLVFALLFVLYCAVLLAAYLFPDLAAVVSANKYFMRMYAWIALTCAVSRLKLNPYAAFVVYGVALVGLYHPLVSATSSGRGFLYDFLQFEHSDDILAVALFVLIVASVAIVVNWYLHDKGWFSRALADAQATEEAPQAPPDRDASIEAQCRRATEGAGLTAREFEVLVLAYRGHSAKRIGEELYVTEATVRGHLTHVYQKLGIRSKQELIDFVDAQGDRQG